MSSTARIGFAGLSHLGIVSSAAAAARGFSILAFDERPGLTGDLAAGSEGEGRLDLVLAGDEQTVDEVDPGCLDLDHHATGRGRQIRPFLHPQQ